MFKEYKLLLFAIVTIVTMTFWSYCSKPSLQEFFKDGKPCQAILTVFVGDSLVLKRRGGSCPCWLGFGTRVTIRDYELFCKDDVAKTGTLQEDIFDEVTEEIIEIVMKKFGDEEEGRLRSSFAYAALKHGCTVFSPVCVAMIIKSIKAGFSRFELIDKLSLKVPKLSDEECYECFYLFLAQDVAQKIFSLKNNVIRLVSLQDIQPHIWPTFHQPGYYYDGILVNYCDYLLATHIKSQ